MTTVLPVILCGGSGTRLWPMSREAYPKQFHALVDDKSLFENTVLRATTVSSGEALMVVCNESQRFLAAAQARNVYAGNLTTLLEPVARNTAAAIAAAACYAVANGADPVLVVLPSDHHIPDSVAFSETVAKAVEAAQAGFLVTFGIKPTAPETGYGYIEQSAESVTSHAFKVKQFVEKPDLQKAQALVASGKHTWNSGMFVFKAGVFLAELQKHTPAVYTAVADAVYKAKSDLDFVRLDAKAFEATPKISVDYAVFEKSDKVAIVPYAGAWSDLGSWDAVAILAQSLPTQQQSTNTVQVKASNNHVIASKPVALVGVHDVVVVDTADALLVVRRSEAQDVKLALSDLVKHNPDLGVNHRKVYRPWGWYDSVEEGLGFKVKRICVNPGAALSLQKHAHRAEHWIVVKGVAEVTNGEQTFTLHSNQSTYIPVGAVHRLANRSSEPLEIIEVQTGTYLGEDDIVRLEDAYGRN